MPQRAFPVVAALVLLAGCGAPAPPEASATPPPDVVTRPGDYASGGAGSHVHDYWGPGDRLTVVDDAHPGGTAEGAGPGLAGGSSVPVMAFRPDSGAVVPQGTAAVEVTFAWTDAPGDQYRDPELWVKTASDNESRPVGPLENGETLAVAVGAEQADLPHQLLSAWAFELRMSAPDPLPLRFKGAVELKAIAVRGLPLPVFPAHPDLWQGRTVLPLLEAEGALDYVEDPVDHGCDGAACPTTHRPASGAVVPPDAGFVVAVLAVEEPATRVGLFYHSAASRDFAPAEPDEESGGVRIHRIPVDGYGDGPYAQQSQWEFTVLPSQGLPLDAAVNARYTLSITVERS